VLSGRGLCDGLITRPEESYRLWSVVMCDQETSKTRRLKPATGLWKIQSKWVVTPGKQQQQADTLHPADSNPAPPEAVPLKSTFSVIYIYDIFPNTSFVDAGRRGRCWHTPFMCLSITDLSDTHEYTRVNCVNEAGHQNIGSYN
jgi:hypothetical protein